LGAVTSTSYSASSLTTNYICALQQDLQNYFPGGTLEYSTVGTAPNRILIVQWNNWGRFATPLCHFNFQIWLYETTNAIEFHYGNCTSGFNGSLPFEVGLVGNGSSDFNLRKTLSNDWLFSQAKNQLSIGGMQLNSLTNFPSGLVYIFGNSGSSSAGLNNVVAFNALGNTYVYSQSGTGTGSYNLVCLEGVTAAGLESGTTAIKDYIHIENLLI